ncbi:MAG: zf-HC2 domain-containing protein [Ardenticatenaceae bacterium]|nr:zf-HC2 domain-containing protein [Ardenticatenaceae bacterium]
MKQQHVHRQIPDYVLGLLPQKEQQQVDQHTQVCTNCRLALRREQELGQLVHSTLTTATQPPANLRRFMPAIPHKSHIFWDFSFGWQRPLLPLTLVLFLLVGSLSFYLREQRGLWLNPTPTALAITATLTDSPTATITKTRVEQTVNLQTTAVPITSHVQPEITATPAPNPTPIAALNLPRDT